MRPASRSWLENLWVAAFVLAGLVLAFPEAPWHWDEYQLAYALGDFDLSRHQPHPPGYYLFVVAGRALEPLAGDPFRALRCVSALAVALFAALAAPSTSRGLAARLVWGGAAAAFALLSPLTQRFGVAALSYAAEGAVWLAWLLAFAAAPRGRARLLLAFCAGLAGGVRPTLVLWCAVMLLGDAARRREWRALAALAAAAALGVAAWAVPLLVESGGVAAYRADVAPLAAGNVWAKSVFASGAAGLASRVAQMSLDLLSALGGLALVSVAAAVVRLRSRSTGRAALDPLLVGAAVAFGFYALVIYDTPGYLAAVAFPLVAWSLRVAAGAVADAPPPRQWAAGAAALLAVTATAALPAQRIGVDYAAHARLLAARFDAVRERFDPQASVLVTSREYWDYGLRHVGDALPGFTTLQLARDPYFTIANPARPYLASRGRRVDAFGPEPLDLASLTPGGRLAHVIYMVPFDADEFVASGCAPLAEALPTSGGEQLLVLRVPPGARVEARGGRLRCSGVPAA